MTARAFRCRECGYPFRTAEQGWARDTTLMCPACGSADLSILKAPPSWDGVTMTALEAKGEAARDEARPDAARLDAARPDAAAAWKKANELVEQPTGTDPYRSR